MTTPPTTTAQITVPVHGFLLTFSLLLGGFFPSKLSYLVPSSRLLPGACC